MSQTDLERETTQLEKKFERAEMKTRYFVHADNESVWEFATPKALINALKNTNLSDSSAPAPAMAIYGRRLTKREYDHYDNKEQNTNNSIIVMWLPFRIAICPEFRPMPTPEQIAEVEQLMRMIDEANI